MQYGKVFGWRAPIADGGWPHVMTKLEVFNAEGELLRVGIDASKAKPFRTFMSSQNPIMKQQWAAKRKERSDAKKLRAPTSSAKPKPAKKPAKKKG